MSDTLETDKVEQYVQRDINRKWVLSDFAKRLERERDEARRDREDSIGYGIAAGWVKKLRKERDDARKSREIMLNQLWRICSEGFGDDDTIGGELADDYILRKLAELRAGVERLKANKARMELAIGKAKDCFQRIENTRWGYDGDCGVVAIANEGNDLIDSAMKGDK